MAVDRIPVHANRARKTLTAPLTTSRGGRITVLRPHVSGPGVPVRRFTLEVSRQIAPGTDAARVAVPAILDWGQLDGAG